MAHSQGPRPRQDEADDHATTPVSFAASPSEPGARPINIITSTNSASPSVSASASTSSATAAAATPLHTPRSRPSDPSLAPSTNSASKRASFVDTLRSSPASPRFNRNPSFSANTWQELFMNSSTPHKPNGSLDPLSKGRDWRSVQIHEIIDPVEVRFVELDTSVEDATKSLIKGGAPNVVMVRESVRTKTAINTFDYSDLNAYLLMVLGLHQADQVAHELAARARTGEVIPLKDLLDHLGARELPAFLPHTARLPQAMEVLGGGSHRLIVCKEGTSEVCGILSQLRFVRFFWENHQSFLQLESLYSRPLRELNLGVKDVLAINGDRPLSDALQLMHSESITSLPVLDSQKNVIGNISHVDVRLLTVSSSIPLLYSTCIHFISVILSERGMDDGKDSYPVFHVTPWSSLAHTVAKLCATRSHRMWIVDAPSPASSVPPSPSVHVVQPHFTLHANSMTGSGTLPPRQSAGVENVTPGPPYTPATGVTPSSSQMVGGTMSGHLNGVVSLTDILNLFARASGLSPEDPEQVRRRRRRSSSSSLRPSMDSMRPSGEFIRGSGELSRSQSTASRR